MDSDLPTAEGLRWQVGENTRDIEELRKATRDIPADRKDIEHLSRRVDAIYRLLWTVAGALILLTISVLFAGMQIGVA